MQTDHQLSTRHLSLLGRQILPPRFLCFHFPKFHRKDERSSSIGLQYCHNPLSDCVILLVPVVGRTVRYVRFSTFTYLVLQRTSVAFCSAKVAWASTLAAVYPFCAVARISSTIMRIWNLTPHAMHYDDGILQRSYPSDGVLRLDQ